MKTNSFEAKIYTHKKAARKYHKHGNYRRIFAFGTM